MCAVNFVSHRENAFILIGRFVIRQVCFFDVNLYVPVHSMTTLNLYNVVEFSCTIRIQVMAEEATS